MSTTIPQVFMDAVERFGDRVAFRHKDYGRWHETTWREFRARVARVGYAARAVGVESGDRVGVVGENSPEWLFIELGMQSMGATPVGIYTTNAAEQVEYVVAHAGCKLLFVENEEQLDKWLQFRDRVPDLQRVIVWDDTGLREFSDPQVMTFDEFMEGGASREHAAPDEFAEQAAAVTPEALSLIVYTSGTTGPPKGAMLTHANVVWMGTSLVDLDPERPMAATDEVMSFLPLCHIFEQIFSVFIPLRTGYIVNFVESPDTVAENMREISPTIAYGVPRMWEKYQSLVEIRMADADWFNRVVYGMAMQVGRRRAALVLDRKPVPGMLRMLNFLAEWTVFRPLRERLGMDRAWFALSGAAPISPDVLTFFHAIGLPIVEGYGQTEASGVISGTSVNEFRPGYVGKAIPGLEMKLSDEGEILVQSPGVFAGYYRDPDGTARALQDGWLATGDIGRMDNGYVAIVDRKKDLIITAGGKNIAPQHIENTLKCSPYITDAVVIGDRRKFLSALVVLDEDNVVKFAQDHRVSYSTYSELAEEDAIHQLIKAEVAKANKQVSRVENVREFRILPKRLYQEDGEVTPTMKVKRAFINDTYSDLIEEMYRA